MKNNFWNEIKKPIIALAPLANVTDAAFRRIIAKYSKPDGPDVMFTEFVSADGLFLGGKDTRNVLMKDLIYTKEERPIVAQFFTAKTNMIGKAAHLAASLDFDGIDINMGCPDKSIEKQGAGAALIKNPKLARDLIQRVKAETPNLPISVKTRIGYNKNELETWLPTLLEEEPKAIILHLRTRKEMSRVSADWESAKRAVRIRDKMGVKTLILGNGDVLNVDMAKKKASETGVDGVMLGRGIFGNPFLFNKKKDASMLSIKNKLLILVEHTLLFEELLGSTKNFAHMKKHFKAYVTGFDGAKELRISLMATENAKEVSDLINNYLDIVTAKQIRMFLQ